MGATIHRYAVSGLGLHVLDAVAGTLIARTTRGDGAEDFNFYAVDDGVVRSYEIFIAADASTVTFPDGFTYAGPVGLGFHFASREVVQPPPEEAGDAAIDGRNDDGVDAGSGSADGAGRSTDAE